MPLDQRKNHDHNQPKAKLTGFGEPGVGIKRKKKKKRESRKDFK